MIIIFFLLPVCAIAFSFLIYSHTGTNLTKIAVIDYDHSFLSKGLIQSLHNNDQFKITPVNKKGLTNRIASGELDCAIVIPAGFGDSIYCQQMKKVDLISVKGETVTAWIKNDLNIQLQNLRDIGVAAGNNQAVFNQIYNRYQQTQRLSKVVRVDDQSAYKRMTTQSIGFLIILMMVGVGNTIELILREKRSRTFYRICAAPVNARTYLLANVLANLFIVIIQVLLVLLVMTQIFGMASHVPFIQLFTILILFGLAVIALGLLIVAFSKDTSQASTLQNLIIMPTCMLAGCFWPSDIMPEAIQRIADILPQKWAIAAIQKLQEGAGFNQVLINAGFILGFALALFLVAVYRFNRNDKLKTFV
jgi:ABC-2 type transport system permease protein